jgi:hypothetical protein
MPLSKSKSINLKFNKFLLLADKMCEGIACQNGGYCNVVVKSSAPTAECWCLKGYGGYNCEMKYGSIALVKEPYKTPQYQSLLAYLRTSALITFD